MTMIPLSSFATSGLHQTSLPWGHCIRFPGARFVSHAVLITLPLPVRGVAATTPRRRLAK